MSENGESFRIPSEDVVAHAMVVADLKNAAAALWTPNPETTNLFHYNKSAAGLSLSALMPEGSLQRVVTIDDPSVRMRRSLRRVLADDYTDGSRVTLSVFDPREAASFDASGAYCVISNVNPSGEEMVMLDLALNYAALQQICEQGGVYEKRSTAQRLGRWAIRQLEIMGASGAPAVDGTM
jgi:hypothetical protein